MEFKSWLLSEESRILLGTKRSADSSGFCLHNPKINNFAKSNSTNMFIVFAFVFYTIQKSWPIVTQTFPHFLKWIFEEAIQKDNWDFSKQSFAQYAGASSLGSNKQYPLQARYLADFWKKKNEIYSNIMSLLKGDQATAEYEVFKYILQNVTGLGVVKAAFVAQLIIGKYGCIDSVNTRVYRDLIASDIKKRGKASGFKLVARKTRKGNIITDDEGKPIMDPVTKNSILGLKGYIYFLQTLEDLYGDDISKVLWDDWCEIVDKKIAHSDSGDEITLSLGNQSVKIKPYRELSHFKDLISREKESLSRIDPESTGKGVSLGHLDAITQSGDYRTPDIKRLENTEDF